ncbi:MAG: response regulator, partial [Planctomycetota bacterium]|nr:response regulator [Planctomycetota bacterium]
MKKGDTVPAKHETRVGKTILVVDDDEKIRNVVAHFLEKEGFAVLKARSGKECLSTVQRETVDLVLLDVMMAEMDGFVVCEKLRLNEKTFKIPVIFLTALTDHSSKILGSLSGGSDYVTKPFKKNELLAAIRTKIGGP